MHSSRRVTLAFAAHGLRTTGSSGAAGRRARARRDRGAATAAHLSRAAAARGARGRRAARPGRRRGEPVALVLEPGLPFVEALHGCLLLGRAGGADRPAAGGARAQACSPRARRPRRAPAAARERRVPAARDAGRPEEVALVVHTSGTTGAPKPVELTYGNIRANARGVAQAMRARRRRALAVPAAALARRRPDGLPALGDPRHHGGVPPPFDASRRRSCVRTHHGRLARARRSSRGCSTPARRPGPRCARPARRRRRCRRALLARARDAGLPVCPSYGLTAGVLDGDRGRARRPRDRRAGAARRRASPIAADGEILVSGPPWRASAACAPAISAGSTTDGRLVVTGRKGDMIVTGGENVAPGRGRGRAARAPGRGRGRGVRPPDPEWGEAVIAIVVLRARRRAPSSCARTAWSGSPASRCRRRSSSWTRCRAPRPASAAPGAAHDAAPDVARAASAGERRGRLGGARATRCARARCPSRPG